MSEGRHDDIDDSHRVTVSSCQFEKAAWIEAQFYSSRADVLHCLRRYGPAGAAGDAAVPAARLAGAAGGGRRLHAQPTPNVGGDRNLWWLHAGAAGYLCVQSLFAALGIRAATPGLVAGRRHADLPGDVGR